MLKNKKAIFIIILLGLVFLAPEVHAQGFLDTAGMNPDCMAKGKCSLDDVAAGFISLIRLLLGGIAAIALVFLVWGGVQWIWSGGNADKVKRGKDIFFNTIAALVLAFGSYMITSLFINDILQPEEQYRVTSEEGGGLGECINKEMGEACYTASFTNYVCSGEELGDRCMTKCQLINTIPDNRSSLDFYGWGFACASLSSNPGAFHLTGNCPGDADNVCILYEGSTAISEEDVETHAWMQATIDGLDQL